MHRCNAVYTRRTVSAVSDEQALTPLGGAEAGGPPAASPCEAPDPTPTPTLVSGAVRGHDGSAR